MAKELIGMFAIEIRGYVFDDRQNSFDFNYFMANSPVDKSEEFVKSGMKLITERNSDELLKKAKENKTKSKR